MLIRPKPIPQVTTAERLMTTEFGTLNWVWHGYLASGAISLMTSQWKTGKTTLMSVLLSKMATGGEMAGRAVNSGRVIVVTEEDERLWAPRRNKLHIGSNVGWIIRPFVGPPSMTLWFALVERLIQEHHRDPLALAVIDPLATLFPSTAERYPPALLTALAPLRKLADRGPAVLLLHHPRKGRPKDAIVPRGTDVLPSTVDVLMELDSVKGGPTTDRRRWLRAVSRYEETPSQCLLELNEAGTDYSIVSDPGAGEFTLYWPILKMVFEDAMNRLTRRAILKEWPEDFAKPHPATLWRWLERARADKLVLRSGTGRKSDPFKYCLPGREHFLLPELPPLEPLEICGGLRGG